MSKIVSFVSETPSGSKQTVYVSSDEEIKEAISELDGEKKSVLMMEVERAERYITILCNRDQLCICSIQEGDVIYMLKADHANKCGAFPDYPPEYCVPRSLVLKAIEAYMASGLPHKELEWDKL